MTPARLHRVCVLNVVVFIRSAADVVKAFTFRTLFSDTGEHRFIAQERQTDQY
jgi:hypothetical protein